MDVGELGRIFDAREVVDAGAEVAIGAAARIDVLVDAVGSSPPDMSSAGNPSMTSNVAIGSGKSETRISGKRSGSRQCIPQQL